jgi:hypothetical protein
MTARRVLAVTAMALGLAGCGAGQDIAQIIGTGPNTDTTPVKGQPLTVPPDYDLRPPRGGGERTKAAEASRRARSTVIGNSAVASTGASAATAAGAASSSAGKTAGEAALLRRASAGETVDPGVRNKVNAETQYDQEQEKAFADKLLKYKDNDQSQGSGSGVSANPKPTIKRQGEIF